MAVDIQKFDEKDLKRLFRPQVGAPKGRNGQVTIIGGSSLFHGAPILALKVASRIVDMVYFGSPEPSVGKVAEKLKSQLCSFIWVPWEETEEYIEKSDAILIGPGFMREPKTREITETLLAKFSHKRWIIDAGSLQMMEADWIPKGAILTPNQKEFEMLFGAEASAEKAKNIAKQYQCFLLLKTTINGPQAFVCSPEGGVDIFGGNAGLTKGGTGDILAGLTVALAAKNEPFLAAQTAAFIVKLAADELYKRAGFAYNADDLTEEIPMIMKEIYVSA